MTASAPQVKDLPIAAITVGNPRARNERVFNELVSSIAQLGLKKPITVSARPDGSGYDLVCGQGRLEAFNVLGQSHIPAIVIEASAEDCYVMSLVENLARRKHASLELVRELGALHERGYSAQQIAVKTGFSDEYIAAILYLLEHGENRLIMAVEKGVVPPSIATEIVRAKEADVQQALTDAYEQKLLPGNQVVAIRRIIDQRNQSGIARSSGSRPPLKKSVTAANLVRAYRSETERQKSLVRKASLAQSRLLFVTSALKRLLAEENFLTLLRAEGLNSLPKPLAERIGIQVQNHV
jgi:ParB family chromosome partitioning protein